MDTRHPDIRPRPPGPSRSRDDDRLEREHHHRLHDRHRADDHDDEPPGAARCQPKPR